MSTLSWEQPWRGRTGRGPGTTLEGRLCEPGPHPSSQDLPSARRPPKAWCPPLSPLPGLPSPSKPATRPNSPRPWVPEPSPPPQTTVGFPPAAAGHRKGTVIRAVTCPALKAAEPRPPAWAARGSDSTWATHTAPGAREGAGGRPTAETPEGAALGSGCSKCFGENPAEGGALPLGPPRPWPRAAGAQGPQERKKRQRAGQVQAAKLPQSWGTWSPVAPAPGLPPPRQPCRGTCRVLTRPWPVIAPPHRHRAALPGPPALRWAPPVPHWPLPAPTPRLQHRRVPAAPTTWSPAGLFCSPVSTTASKPVPELRSPPCYLPTIPVPWYRELGPASLPPPTTPGQPQGPSPLRGRLDRGSSPPALPSVHKVPFLHANPTRSSARLSPPLPISPRTPEFITGHRFPL